VTPEACADRLLSLVGAGSTVRVLGDGPTRYTEAFSALARQEQLPMDTLPPSGGAVASLAASRALAGDFDDPRRLAPLYVRASEAELSLAKR
jgi:hypothetical protein